MAAAAVAALPRFVASEWPADVDHVWHSDVSALGAPVAFEPVGRWFEAHAARIRHNRTISQEDALASKAGDDADDDEDEDDEEETPELLALNPTEWKQHDLYAIMGLSRLRYRATDDDIKRAFKRKVLRHHPDKKKATAAAAAADADGDDEGDDYFKCVKKAYEILSDPVRRRSFDSIDPEFDDEVPGQTDNAEVFYREFSAAFERNAHWSTSKGPVPMLGDDSTPFEEVERFYDFWYNLESWREFSWLDEEDKDKGENRDEKRWIERQNKSLRAKRKKDEMSRLIRLVDNARASDPRIRRHLQEQKDKKERAKQEKANALRMAAEEKERQAAEERRMREAAAAEARAREEAEKAGREERKKAMRKERKQLRTVAKAANYYFPVGAAGDAYLERVGQVELLCERLSLEDIIALNNAMADPSAAQAAMEAQIEKMKSGAVASEAPAASREKEEAVAKPWSDIEVSALIKAAKQYPVGSSNRWELITAFVNSHAGGARSESEVITRAKDMKNMESAGKEKSSQAAFARFEQTKKHANETHVPQTASVRAEAPVAPAEPAPSPVAAAVAAAAAAEAAEDRPWSAEEQKRLEEAMRGVSASALDRWDRIAARVGRSKKDCIKRYKELVEMVKSKKSVKK